MSTDEQEPQVRPFAAYLTETNGGRTHRQLSDAQHQLIEEVLRTGKSGTLTLTVTIAPDDVESRRLVISEKVTTKLPVASVKKSIFWANPEGNLVRTDPSQMSFGDIRPVANAAPEQRNHA